MKRIYFLFAVFCLPLLADKFDPIVVAPKTVVNQSKKVRKAIEKDRKLVADMQKEQQKIRAKIQKKVSNVQASEPEIIAWENSVRKANGWDDSYTYDRRLNQWLYHPNPSLSESASRENKK